MEEIDTIIPYAKGIEIYSKSPLWLQDVFALFARPIPRSVMLGPGFHGFFEELNKTQWYKPERLRRFQESRLRALLKHAYQNVPYYHKTLKEENVRPRDVRTIEDLKKLPILTKQDVRNHSSQLIAVNAKDYKCGLSRTSGSTGRPLTFLLDQQNREMEYASQWRHRVWANINFSSRIANFRGTLGWRKFERDKPSWKFNALSKELEFNILGMDNYVLKMYVKQLKKFRPDLVEGYPSAVELLAAYMLEHEISGIFPTAVETSSEKLSDNQRSVIEEAFRCKVYDWYGQSEYVVSAGQCPDGNYHIVESGIMEFIRDGEQVGEGEMGEIVGTGLYNYSMPFIRYRIGDIGNYSEEKCNCGRRLPVLQSLEGRVSETIITPDGKLLSGMSFEHYWKHRIGPYTPNVDYVHIIQKSKRRLLVEMVRRDDYSNEETQTILRELKELLGSEIEIEFRNLDSIPIRRKWSFTESELDVSLI